MDPELVLHLEIAAVVVMAVIIVAVVLAASGGACDDAAAVHAADVESALGADTLMTYEQATAGKKGKEKGRCAICQWEYGEGDAGELVRVVPACGHFYHARCDVDRWLRKRRTCPICRGGLCQWEYGEGEAGELVWVVPACGHFYHARCDVDRWLRKRRTCPICRGGLWPPQLPGLPRPECPPMPPRMPV